MTRLMSRFTTAALLLLLIPPAARAQAPRQLDAAETQAALRRLAVAGSVLYVAAHPDDENTALLAYLARGRGARTAYLSLTRGDGGQNILGSEKGALLGVVRTQELLAARRIDGAEQFFTRAIDFGFTKSPEETFRFWDHDAVLADVVWVVRRFRPDVMIARFPTTGEGGHGQHTASAILASEAFDAAGDPARFPEQLKNGVTPWKPKRLVWNVFNFRPEPPPGADKMLSVDVGGYDPLLGKSYTEIAAESRTMHMSQAQGTPGRRGPALNYFVAPQGRAGDERPLRRRGHDVAPFRAAARSWPVRSKRPRASTTPRTLRPACRCSCSRAASWLKLAQRTSRSPRPSARRSTRSSAPRAGLWVEAAAADPYATPGGEVKVTTTVVNRSGYPLKFETVGVSSAGADVLRAELKTNQPLTRERTMRVPADAAYSQPYWLREEPSQSLFRVGEQGLVGAPEGPPALSVPVTAVFGEGADSEAVTFNVPVLYRWTDRVRGDLYRPVDGGARGVRRRRRADARLPRPPAEAGARHAPKQRDDRRLRHAQT